MGGVCELDCVTGCVMGCVCELGCVYELGCVCDGLLV